MCPKVDPGGLGSYESQNLDGSNDAAAMRWQFDRADTITHVGFSVSNIGGTPPTYKVTLQSLDADGEPDGTELASGTITPVSTGWKWVALGSSYGASAGEMIAATLEYDSGTINSSNDMAVAYAWDGWGMDHDFPSGLTKTTTAWTPRGDRGPAMAMKSSSNVYGLARSDGETLPTGTSAAGERIAAIIRPPFDVDVKGFWWAGRTNPTSGDTTKAGIWTTGNTLVQGNTALQILTGASEWHYYALGGLASLSSGTDYYIGVEEVDVLLRDAHWVFPSTDEVLNCIFNTGFQHRGRATYNGTSWSTDGTKTPLIILDVDETSLPSGGGAGDPYLAQGLHGIESGIVA